MSYSAQQKTEKGHQPRYGKSGRKINKKFQRRRMRNKMKKIDFVPHYNRYEAGWED